MKGKSKNKTWSKSLFISSFIIRFCLSQLHLVCHKLAILLCVFYRCVMRLDGLGSSLKKEKDILLVIMVEIKKEKQIYHCLNTVYKNHLSTHCTFIYLTLKILKLLHWEQTTNRASRNIKNTQPSESELGLNFPFFFLQLFWGFDYWPLNGGWPLNRWPLNGGSTVYRVGKRVERKSYMMASQYYR